MEETGTRFVGFYTWPKFWAGATLHPDENIRPYLQTIMSKNSLSFTTKIYTLKISRDGMFIFRLEKLAQEIEKRRSEQDYKPDLELTSHYLSYINAILILFGSVLLETGSDYPLQLQEITNKDIFLVLIEDDEWQGGSAPFNTLAGYHQMERFPQFLLPGIPLSHQSVFAGRKHVVKKSVIELLVKYLNGVIKNDELISLLSQFTKSIYEFSLANYDTSLVLSWFIIERIVQEKWERWINSSNSTYPDGTKRINKDRFETLTGRDYPISVVSNILELSNIIPFNLFKNVDKLRHYRNNIVHCDDRYKIQADDCRLAFEVVIDLLEEKLGFRLSLNLNFHEVVL